MTRHLLCSVTTISLALLAASPSHAAPIEALPWAQGSNCTFKSQNCAIKVTFGSVCCGPDAETSAKVFAYVAASSDIKKAIKCNYGKEGDHVLCLVIPNSSKTRSIFSAIKHMIPPRGTGPSSRGVTSVAVEGE